MKPRFIFAAVKLSLLPLKRYYWKVVVHLYVKQCRSASRSATPLQRNAVASEENGAVFCYLCSRAGVLPMFRAIQNVRLN
jgi:hypothetical protein